MTEIVVYKANKQLKSQTNLEFAYITRKKFFCAICKSNGDTLLCLCTKCKRQLHPRCAGIKSGTVHNTDDGGKQILLPSPEKIPQSCPECLKSVGNDTSVGSCSADAPFSTITTGYSEAKQEPHKLTEGNSECMVHMFKPGHELIRKNDGTIYHCTGCKTDSFGLHYECRNASCPFVLHVECMSPRKTTTHHFFPNSTFAFSCVRTHRHSNVFCNACGIEVEGYYYHSLDGQNNLHPCCINLPKETICDETREVMTLQQKTTSDCVYCNKKGAKVDKHRTDQIWSYVAKETGDNLHVRCMIKMLSDMKKNDSVGHLISCKMSTSKDGIGMMNLQMALHNARFVCTTRFNTLKKYAKIALRAIIAALMGDTTTLMVNSAIAISSKQATASQ